MDHQLLLNKLSLKLVYLSAKQIIVSMDDLCFRHWGWFWRTPMFHLSWLCWWHSALCIPTAPGQLTHFLNIFPWMSYIFSTNRMNKHWSFAHRLRQINCPNKIHTQEAGNLGVMFHSSIHCHNNSDSVLMSQTGKNTRYNPYSDKRTRQAGAKECEPLINKAGIHRVQVGNTRPEEQ